MSKKRQQFQKLSTGKSKPSPEEPARRWIQECEQKFGFLTTCTVIKYDNWNFVSNDQQRERLGFNGIKKGIKSVDFCIIDENKCLWLLEVNDYRKSKDPFPAAYHEELTAKFLFSMSGLFAARFAASDAEKEFAQQAAEASSIRFAVHLELPVCADKWERCTVDVADIQLKMEERFARISPNFTLTSQATSQNLPWSVKDVTA